MEDLMEEQQAQDNQMMNPVQGVETAVQLDPQSSIFELLLREEQEERSRSGGPRSEVLKQIINKRYAILQGMTSPSGYSINEHMAVARTNYGVPPEIVYGAGVWGGLQSYPEEVMRSLAKAYAERKVTR